MSSTRGALLFLTRPTVLAAVIVGYELGVAVVKLVDQEWFAVGLALVVAGLAFVYIVRHTTIEVTE